MNVFYVLVILMHGASFTETIHTETFEDRYACEQVMDAIVEDAGWRSIKSAKCVAVKEPIIKDITGSGIIDG